MIAVAAIAVVLAIFIRLDAAPAVFLLAGLVLAAVVDKERALVTSANFTQAAQERNIEAGVLIAEPSVANALQVQFETLVEDAVLKRVPGR